MLPTLLAGFGLGLSLIVAIGAQNLFVLRQGVRREHVFAVAAVCAVSDAVLIVLGVSGLGLILQTLPWLVDVVRWAGFVFLLAYGLLAARRAIRPSGQTLDAGSARTLPTTRLLPTLLTCLALTWLLVMLVAGDSGVLALRRAREKLDGLETEAAAREREGERLRRAIASLKGDDREVERIAREDLMMGRPDEEVILVPDVHPEPGVAPGH